MPDNKPTQEELDRIIRIWNQKHPKYKGMLEAQPYELGEDSDWYWSQTDRQYIDKNDNKVPWTVIGGLVVALMVGNKLSSVTYGGLSTYGQLAEGLKSGVLSVADWKAGMQSLVTMGQQTGILVSNGGVEFMTNSDWSYVNSQIEKQFKFLDGFAKDITDNPEKWMNGRLDNRMRLYQESAYSAYQNGLRREAALGGMDEERRVLGVADHCFIAGTMVNTPTGERPIESLNIGDEVITRYGAKKITQTFCNDYHGDLYEVSSKNKKIVATANHPFYTSNGWKRADELQESDNVMLFENGSYVLNSNISIPYSFNKIPTRGKIFISSGISGLLSFLSLCKRFVSWMTMPVFPVRFNNQSTNTNIDNKLRFEDNGIFKTNSEICKNFMQSFFKSRRFFFLHFSGTEHKFFNNIRPTKRGGSQSSSSSRKFRGIVFSHIFSRFTANNLFCRFFRKQNSFMVCKKDNFFMGNRKFFSAPRSTINRIIFDHKINHIFSPVYATFKFIVARLTEIRIKIFFIAALTIIAAFIGERFTSTLSAYIAIPLAFIAAYFTWFFGRSFRGSSYATIGTKFNIPISSMPTSRASSFDSKFFIGEMRHNLLLPCNGKYSLILPHSIKVYNIEVDGAHEYIANGFMVHNCNGCLEQAGLGWQPIGTLDEIGAEECGNNCRCEFEYRNSKDVTNE